jgi:F-type H+-transporting ATPase subunit b
MSGKSSRSTVPWPRRVALLAMVLVTGWSVWALGQPSPHGARPQPGMPGQVGQPGRPMPQVVPGIPANPMGGAPTMKRPLPTRPPAAPPAEAHPSEGSEGKEEPETEGPAAFNFGEFGKETPPYVAMLINFGILVGGYYLLGKDSIAAGLKSRREGIQKELEEAARMKAEAEERAKKYQARLATLEQEMETAREALVRAGEAERERIVKDAEAKAERMRKDAEFLVEQELKQIRLDLWRDAVDTAITAAGELLKKRVTPADQERLAEEYLADLGSKPKTALAGGAS